MKILPATYLEGYVWVCDYNSIDGHVWLYKAETNYTSSAYFAVVFNENNGAYRGEIFINSQLHTSVTRVTSIIGGTALEQVMVDCELALLKLWL